MYTFAAWFAGHAATKNNVANDAVHFLPAPFLAVQEDMLPPAGPALRREAVQSEAIQVCIEAAQSFKAAQCSRQAAQCASGAVQLARLAQHLH